MPIKVRELRAPLITPSGIDYAANMLDLRLTWLVCVAGTLATSAGVRAEALPGSLELSGGAHFMALPFERCAPSLGFAVDDEACDTFPLFMGLDVALRSTLGPDWFSLGFRMSGSMEVNPDVGNPYVACTGASAFCIPTSLDRSLWLVRSTLEARVDPVAWPRALWLAVELGAAMALATGSYQDPGAAYLNRGGEPVDASEEASDPKARARFSLLGGVAAGWDLLPVDSVMVGLDVRAQMMQLSAAGNARANELDINLPIGLYFALGVHAGSRW